MSAGRRGRRGVPVPCRRIRSALAAVLLALAPAATLRAQAVELHAEDVAGDESGTLGPGHRDYLEAMSFLLTGLHAAAAAAFERAIAAEPSEPRYYNNYSAMYLGLEGSLSEAERIAERGIAVAPDHAPLWNNLGIARLRLGRPKEAVEAFERALELEPESGETHVWLARSHWRLATESEPPDGEALRKACAEMMTATVLLPESPVVHFQLGKLLELAGDDEAALTAYETATRLAPEHPEGHLKVAELKARIAAAEEEALSPPQ